MKIIRLKSDNIMRLVAVDIAPDGNLITIGGANGAGKSSVLNSIAMALGGAAMCPPEPIRAGETAAKIEVDLGDLRVTRRFSRTLDAESGRFSETTSTLVVTNKEGARYPSPQAMLDALVGKIAFDPLAFAQEDPKRQAETLRRLVGLDVSDLVKDREIAALKRADAKKRLAALEARVAAMSRHPDAVEVPMAAISDEMLRAEQLREAAATATRTADRAKDARTAANDKVGRLETVIEQLSKQLADRQEELKIAGVAYDASVARFEEAEAAARAAAAAVPDTAALRTRLAEAEATNARVRVNMARAALEVEATTVAAEVEGHHKAVLRAETAKDEATRAAVFPVAGLGLSDDGVMFHALPFSQASTSEQLRVSVAVGLALNPKVRVLLVRNGNALDEDSLKAVAAQAEEAGAQVWCEWVTKDAAGVSVMIEDGEVKK